MSQSDYLLKFAEFQEREAVLGQPVAIVVTSRSAVANRAQLPDGTVVVRLEPFDAEQGQPLAGELEHRQRGGIRPVGAAATDRRGRSAPSGPGAQPLLLLMLALYDAQDNSLQTLARSAGVRTVRADCLDWTLIWNERQLHRVLTEYLRHYQLAVTIQPWR